MSLDVYLRSEEKFKKPRGSGIFVRCRGATVQVSDEEWHKLHPDSEPVRYHSEEQETDELYHANITHNMGQMARTAGIYGALWRPEEQAIVTAVQLIDVLGCGLYRLLRSPEAFKVYNPENGWGSYEALVSFVSGYLKASIDHPNARVEVSR